MKKYYKIPMTERIVYANDVSLFQILKDNYPDLYNREQGRIELTYGGNNPGVMTPQIAETIKNYNEQTSQIYKEMAIPQYIIAVRDKKGKITEYATDTVLTTRGINCFFEGREISRELALTYLSETPDYEEQASKIFKKEVKKTLIKINYNKKNSDKDN